MKTGIAALVLILSLAARGIALGLAPADLSYQDARPVVQALEEVLPTLLKGKSSEEQASAWPRWLAEFNSQVRSRLMRGDEDTLVNFLLFGTSYTRQPRLAAADFKPVAGISEPDTAPSPQTFQPRTQQILQGRLDDLARALADPKNNDRLLFFRSFLAQKGFKPGDSAGTERLKGYVLGNLIRVLKEASNYAAAMDASRRLGDASAEFAERSTLFRDRGLSLDTSLKPDFAIEQALRAMKDQLHLGSNSIRRVAIIGPGLDFTDKDAGYDYYPQQTIQPFALMDSLSRLGLATPASLEVTTLDVSPRVNDHLNRACQLAIKGVPYTVQLPRDSGAPWKEAYVRYWERFGDRLGSPVPAAAIPPGVTGLAVRSVRFRPDVVARIHPADLNIVTQHLPLPAAQRFDLIIATNVFVYYDVFQQCLALVNVERMLKPGGFLLSNNALLELPSSKIHSVDYTTVVYSDRPADGDRIVWYRRLPD